MNLYEFMPVTTSLLAEEGHRYGPMAWNPWFLVARLVFLVLIAVAIWLVVRRLRGRQGENTLRDVYARGEITETEYRERLAVLRATKR